MSIHVLSWVLKKSKARLGSRLVLLVLADYAGEDGRGAYPSVDTIANEAMLSRRAVQAALRSLVDEGLIRDVGVSRYGTRVYDVLMADPGGADSAPAPSGEEDDTGGRSKRREGGADSAPEPSTNPSSDPLDMAADRLFTEWREASGRSEATQFTPKRKRAVFARLREPATGVGFTRPDGGAWSREDDLRAAIRWVCGSRWHVENGHTELAVICRSTEQIDGYLTRAKADAAKQNGGAAASPTMSQYDRAIRS